ncbi:MAG: histidine triad (HIT) family protein [Bacteroidia bacterium]|jgi:histidine triad (HIT) family protein
MPSIFTKIISGEIPSHKIAENEDFIAFLDVFPLVEGHTLVVPKKEVDYIFDLEDEQLGALNIFSKKVAKAIEKAIPCKRIGTAVIGLEVPHAHLHLVPLNSVEDINFSKPKLKPSQTDLAETAEKIRKHLAN